MSFLKHTIIFKNLPELLLTYILQLIWREIKHFNCKFSTFIFLNRSLLFEEGYTFLYLVLLVICTQLQISVHLPCSYWKWIWSGDTETTICAKATLCNPLTFLKNRKKYFTNSWSAKLETSIWLPSDSNQWMTYMKKYNSRASRNTFHWPVTHHGVCGVWEDPPVFDRLMIFPTN